MIIIQITNLIIFFIWPSVQAMWLNNNNIIVHTYVKNHAFESVSCSNILGYQISASSSVHAPPVQVPTLELILVWASTLTKPLWQNNVTSILNNAPGIWVIQSVKSKLNRWNHEIFWQNTVTTFINLIHEISRVGKERKCIRYHYRIALFLSTMRMICSAIRV